MKLLEAIDNELEGIGERIIRLQRQRQMILELPEDMREVDGYSSYYKYSDGDEKLYLYLRGGSNTQLSCECIGATFGKPDFNKHSGDFNVKGKLNDNIDIEIYNVDAPAGCEIRKKRKMTTVYEATCEKGKKL